MNEERPVTIYALCDDTGIRYIGQTRQPLQVRTWQHRFDLATGGAAKIAWIKALRASGQKPRVEVLEVVGAPEADEAERRQIDAARARGCALLNAPVGRPRGQHNHEGREVIRVVLRLPIELHDELERRSAAEDRSLHAEIIHGLRTYTGQGALVRRRRGGRRE